MNHYNRRLGKKSLSNFLIGFYQEKNEEEEIAELESLEASVYKGLISQKEAKKALSSIKGLKEKFQSSTELFKRVLSLEKELQRYSEEDFVELDDFFRLHRGFA